MFDHIEINLWLFWLLGFNDFFPGAKATHYHNEFCRLHDTDCDSESTAGGDRAKACAASPVVSIRLP